MLRALLDQFYRIVFNRQKFEAYIERQIKKAGNKFVAFLRKKAIQLNNPRINELADKVAAALKQAGLR